MSSSTIKDMTELFGGGCSYKDNSCQVFVEFCTYSTTPPFLRKGHPLKNNFPWQHRWIPHGGENFDMSFTVPNVPIKLVPVFKLRSHQRRGGGGGSQDSPQDPKWNLPQREGQSLAKLFVP